MTAKTSAALAAALRNAGLVDMAAKADTDYYHDFLSPLVAPCIQLASDLAQVGTPEALALRQRHLGGEFDASNEESEAWANGDEGRALRGTLLHEGVLRAAKPVPRLDTLKAHLDDLLSVVYPDAPERLRILAMRMYYTGASVMSDLSLRAFDEADGSEDKYAEAMMKLSAELDLFKTDLFEEAYSDKDAGRC